MADLFNLAWMTTTTTGTGTLTLGPSMPAALTFAQAGVPNGATVRYALEDTGSPGREVGYGVYSSSGPTLTRNVIKSTNSDAALNLSGNAHVAIAALAEDFVSHADDYKDFLGLGIPYNLTLAASVAANELTISLKDYAENDPSSSSPCVIPFRSANAANGSYSSLLVTGPNSLTISSGSTMGIGNATPFRLWIVALHDAGTIRLGAINCAGSNKIYPLPEHSLVSSTAEGGAGAADSAGVVYTGTAVTSKALRILGYLEWTSGLTTAGAWSSGPDVIQLFGPGVPRPGQTVQSVSNSFAASSGSNTASTSYVDTNVAADAITLTSPCNRVAYSFQIQVSIATASAEEFLTMSRGGVAIGPTVSGTFGVGTSGVNVQTAGHSGADFPGSVGPHTYKVRAKSSNGATVYWNDLNGGATINIAEIMA